MAYCEICNPFVHRIGRVYRSLAMGLTVSYRKLAWYGPEASNPASRNSQKGENSQWLWNLFFINLFAWPSEAWGNGFRQRGVLVKFISCHYISAFLGRDWNMPGVGMMKLSLFSSTIVRLLSATKMYAKTASGKEFRTPNRSQVRNRPQQALLLESHPSLGGAWSENKSILRLLSGSFSPGWW